MEQLDPYQAATLRAACAGLAVFTQICPKVWITMILHVYIMTRLVKDSRFSRYTSQAPPAYINIGQECVCSAPV